MTQYLISFDDGAMDHIPDSLMGEVGDDAHAVVKEAKEAGVWIFGAGLRTQVPKVVATDGTVADGAPPEAKTSLGGFAIVDVATQEEAQAWAAKIAFACRCDQEVRELMFDPRA